jgi:hypothetical protein
MGMTLMGFLEEVGAPPRDRCEAVKAQAIELLDQICVHPASVTLQQLRNLPVSDTSAFYDDLLGIFAAFGDRHTQCQLPESFMRTLICLPFAVTGFCENGKLRLGVTGSAVDGMQRGDILTAWNGRDPEAVLQEHAALQLGANPEARIAKAIQTLPFRPLGTMPAPKAEPIVLDYIDLMGRSRRIKLEWQRGILNAPLFATESAGDWISDRNLRFRTIRTASGEFGLIQIHSFYEDPESFLRAFLRCLERIPPDGLLLDLRGCEEGIIATAEQLLQLFTDKPIMPEPFEFRATRTIREIVANNSAFRSWRDAFRTGEEYSRGHPLTSCEQANGTGRRYFGPVVVLVDALTYSSAEMFAAGIQDHGIGVVAGAAGRTGGGGGSPWSQQMIFQYSRCQGMRPLQDAPSFRVASRRSRRVGKRWGSLLEGAGVTADVVYPITMNDFLDESRELMETMGGILAKQRNER